jgi:hypothetical protein
MRNQVLEVQRASIGATRVVDEDVGELRAGSVRLRVDRFAVTANTVTYAEMGAMLGYWDFYPTGDEAFGRVPAMGWADVVGSAHDEVATGGRYYGWFPMAGVVDVHVGTIPAGLRDDGAHRREHAPIYRTFTATTADPLYPADPDPATRGDLEDRHALLRGLFMTGFLADVWFASNEWFGARHAVVLSASSKTAIGFADCVERRGAVRLVGVTSTANAGFVADLGTYDEVLTYDDLDRLPTERAVAIDMAGDGAVLDAVHERLGDRLAHSMIVGRTHTDAPMAAPTAGPTPQMFFAPTALEEMGARGVDVAAATAGVADALARFVERSRDWMTVVRATGPEATAATWAEVHAGRVPPSVGRICSLHP